MADATKKLTHTAEQIDAAVGMLLEVYTREEIDDLLAQKITEVPGSGLMTDDEREKLSTLENYDDTEVKSQTALNRSTLGYQRKNLLKNTAVSKTQNGVEFTVNGDGSVTANGTATANADLDITVNNLQDGKYILSGCPEGGGNSTYSVILYRINASNGFDFMVSNSGGDTVKGVSSNTKKYVVRIRIANGYTAENLTFRPMLRYAEIADDTYEPYKPSVEERLAVLEEKFAALEGGGT